ncbi:hypothetical protein HWV62_41826 [Athelia sp. TMB]|nr:hypothetical protein HWV62_41826 [Athelia sp. TMB]
MNHNSRATGANPPHPPTQAMVDGLRWVSPVSSTLDRISPVAMRFKGPQHRLAGVTEEGVWRGLNWTTKADWFDLRVHWRGYLGVDVLKGQQDWRDSDDLIVRVGEGYKLKASVAKHRGARINQLREHLEALEIVLYLNLEGIPYPAFVDTSSLLFLQATKRAVRKAMALSRLYYLDMIAFYRWVREAMDEELIYRGFDSDYPPQEEWTRWMKLPTIGYLIDLHGDWRTHNLPMWKEHRVPVHYIWNEDVEANERFRMWDPARLQARDETPVGSSSRIPSNSGRDETMNGWAADAWMQLRSPIRETSRKESNAGDPRTWSYAIVDFEGWQERPITAQRDIDLFTRIFVYDDKPEGYEPHRTFYRWRHTAGEATDVLLLSLPEPHRQTDRFLRETYKFRYAYPQDREETDHRSLLSRISAPSGPAGPAGPSVTTSREGPSRGRQDRAPSSPVMARPRSDRSASPRAGAREGRRPRSLALDVWREGHRQATDASSSTGSGRAGDSRESSISRRDQYFPAEVGNDAVRSLIPGDEDIYPHDFSETRGWNKKFLHEVIITFPVPEAQWRIRAWLLREPELLATQLLNRALSRFIPFRLEMPEAALPKFTRAQEEYSGWDVVAALYYEPGYRDPELCYTPSAATQASKFRSSVLAILHKPNATAFLFEGGLLARIAYQYGGIQLVRRAMTGLSAAVTLHRDGATSIERSTRRENVSTYEKSRLLGVFKPAEGKTVAHSMFPPLTIFRDYFHAYDGVWTAECEDWFTKQVEHIAQGEILAQTEGEWKKSLRKYRRSAHIGLATLTEARAAIMDEQGPSWEGARLMNVRNLDQTGNLYVD